MKEVLRVRKKNEKRKGREKGRRERREGGREKTEGRKTGYCYFRIA